MRRFENLVEQYHDEIYSYLWRLVDSSGRAERSIDAEDLTQEVFLRAYQGFPRLRPDSNHRAWLYKIATNCAYTELKRGRRRAGQGAVSLDDAEYFVPDPRPGPFQVVASNETLGAVRQVLVDLPPKQKAAVILRYGHGLDYAEVARCLDCSEDSARANVYQAIRRLRSELQDGEALVFEEVFDV